MTTYPTEGEIVAVRPHRDSQVTLGAVVCGERQNGHVTVKFAAGNHFRLPLSQVDPAPQWIIDEYKQIAAHGSA